MGKETIEEALNYQLNFIHAAIRNNDFDLGFKTGGIVGAKWQAERMYSEEEPDYDKIKEVLVEMRKISMTFYPDERMYSEEDMKQFAEWLIKVNFNYTSNITDMLLTWKEQSKKN